jgi:hypothetical protein
MSPVVEPARVEDGVGENDDRLADLIRSLTPEDTDWLWRTIIQGEPHLAD